MRLTRGNGNCPKRFRRKLCTISALIAEEKMRGSNLNRRSERIVGTGNRIPKWRWPLLEALLRSSITRAEVQLLIGVSTMVALWICQPRDF